MAAGFPSPTTTWHDDTYAAIDPAQAELRQAGKTIIITGAGTGIGRETALSFAKAGAKQLVLIGPPSTGATLFETFALLPESETQVSIFPASVTEEAAARKIAKAVGQWDILILNDGHSSPAAPLTQAPLAEYWTNYEVNVKGIVIAAQAFVPTANPAGAAIYAITAGTQVFPIQMTTHLSGYISSSIARVKLMEYLAAENEKLFCVSVHPGIIDRSIVRGPGGDPSKFQDKTALPANFMVWLSQPKTKFLNGKLVFANWDVEELTAKAEEIESSSLFTVHVNGWPFTA